MVDPFENFPTDKYTVPFGFFCGNSISLSPHKGVFTVKTQDRGSQLRRSAVAMSACSGKSAPRNQSGLYTAYIYRDAPAHFPYLYFRPLCGNDKRPKATTAQRYKNTGLSLNATARCKTNIENSSTKQLV
ncbi:MAG: hypothetical protein MR379_02050 [Clostridiales bacterium]|nr:hypothetical protein [Clostridiales bacterium]